MNPAANEFREIERRFLISHLPSDLAQHPSRLVQQGYLARETNTVRLRRDGDHLYVLTIKRGVFPLTEEREIELTAEQFHTIWPLTVGQRISKTRHQIRYGEFTIELDFFHGKHEGLQIAEVEFPNETVCQGFVPPDWFGEEITGQRQYSNAALASE